MMSSSDQKTSFRSCKHLFFCVNTSVGGIGQVSIGNAQMIVRILHSLKNFREFGNSATSSLCSPVPNFSCFFLKEEGLSCYTQVVGACLVLTRVTHLGWLGQIGGPVVHSMESVLQEEMNGAQNHGTGIVWHSQLRELMEQQEQQEGQVGTCQGRV